MANVWCDATIELLVYFIVCHMCGSVGGCCRRAINTVSYPPAVVDEVRTTNFILAKEREIIAKEK